MTLRDLLLDATQIDCSVCMERTTLGRAGGYVPASKAIKLLRKRGWKIRGANALETTATCPKCVELSACAGGHE